jgi:hypothetical protein
MGVVVVGRGEFTLGLRIARPGAIADITTYN